MSKYRPMMTHCDKPMGYHWTSGTQGVSKGYWTFKCYECGAEELV